MSKIIRYMCKAINQYSFVNAQNPKIVLTLCCNELQFQ